MLREDLEDSNDRIKELTEKMEQMEREFQAQLERADQARNMPSYHQSTIRDQDAELEEMMDKHEAMSRENQELRNEIKQKDDLINELTEQCQDQEAELEVVMENHERENQELRDEIEQRDDQIRELAERCEQKERENQALQQQHAVLDTNFQLLNLSSCEAEEVEENHERESEEKDQRITELSSLLFATEDDRLRREVSSVGFPFFTFLMTLIAMCYDPVLILPICIFKSLQWALATAAAPSQAEKDRSTKISEIRAEMEAKRAQKAPETTENDEQIAADTKRPKKVWFYSKKAVKEDEM